MKVLQCQILIPNLNLNTALTFLFRPCEREIPSNLKGPFFVAFFSQWNLYTSWCCCRYRPSFARFQGNESSRWPDAAAWAHHVSSLATYYGQDSDRLIDTIRSNLHIWMPFNKVSTLRSWEKNPQNVHNCLFWRWNAAQGRERPSARTVYIKLSTNKASTLCMLRSITIRTTWCINGQVCWLVHNRFFLMPAIFFIGSS